MKKMWIGLGFLLLIIMGVSAVYYFSENNGQKKETPDGILVIGKHPFKQTESVSFSETTLEKAKKNVSKKIRFILLDHKTNVPKETLDYWIKEKKVVLFYGKELVPENIKTKFGLDVNLDEIFPITTVEVPFVLFGYGYNETNQKNLIYYNQANGDLQQAVFTFIKSIH